MSKQETKGFSVVSIFEKGWLLVFTIVVAIVFGLCEHTFFKVTNLMNILSNACVTGIMGIGLTCILSTGELDFSAGATVSLSTVLMAVILNRPSINTYIVGVILTLLICAGIGLINAFLHIKIRMPALIATMGMSYIAKGVANYLTGGQSVNGLKSWPASFTVLGQGYLFGIIPNPMVVLIVVGVIMVIYTEKTRMGKYMYAVGANPKACDYIGINSALEKFKGFIFCSVLCGLGGIIQGSMLNGASPSLGDTLLLPAITSVMLGATFLKNGVFNVPGTFVGAVLLNVITNGMIFLSLPPWTRDVAQGAMLIMSVIVVVLLRKRNQRRATRL